MRHFPRLASTCVLLIALTACSREAAKQRAISSAEAFLQQGKTAEAIVELNNAAALDPLSGETRLKLAQAYVANGEPEQAFRQFVRAADLMPDDASAQVAAATYMLVASQFEDARTRAEHVLEKEPKNVDAQVVLGNALAGLRDTEGAVDQLNEAIQLEPGRGQLYTNLALVQIKRGQYDAANAAFEKAVQTDPKSVSARLALATFQWALGDIEATRSSLRTALELDPRHVVTHRALAVFYRATGRFEEAEEHLKFVASISPAPGAQFELGDYYIAVGRWQEARSVLEPLRTRTAVADAADSRLAGLAYITGQPAEAHRLIDQVLARNPNYAFALLLKARWLMSEGQVEQALDRARAAVAASPRMLAAQYIRGLAEVRTHRTADAIKSFTEVLRLNPRAAAAQVQLSNLHLMRNAVDSAVLLAEEAIRNAPASLDGYLARIRAWTARGDTEPARRDLAAIKKQLPTVAAVAALEGTINLHAGKLDAAREAFERTARLDPQSIDAFQGLAAIDLQQGRLAQARSRVEVRLDAGDATPAVLLQAGKVLMAAGDRVRAETILRQSIGKDPLDTANYALLGRLLQEDNRLAVARTEFEAAAIAEPGNVSARLMLGLIAHVQGDLASARRWYGDVLKLEPRAALAANNLAAIYADSGVNLDVAQQLAETALEQWPAAAEFQDTLGWVYYQRQLSGQAIPRFQQSVAADPANPVYHYHLGLALSKSGDRDGARTAFQRALELSPGFAEAKQALSTLE